MGSVPGPIKLGGFVPHSTGPLNNTHISECRVAGGDYPHYLIMPETPPASVQLSGI